jgi:hypothetical protein
MDSDQNFRSFAMLIHLSLDQESVLENKPSNLGLRSAAGAGLGLIFGTLILQNNLAIVIGIGAILGLMIGAILDSFRRKEE